MIHSTSRTAPIGLFDSGVGGTTIWKEVNALMPNENTLFIADNKNAPYGEKTKEEIIALCDANTRFLLENNAKIIVVACNTGTTNAISYLRNKYKEVPFIGIEPAIKPASLQSVTKKIGVLATRSTLASDLFAKTSEHLKQEEQVEIIEQVGEGLVDLIEAGRIKSPEMTLLLRKYLLPMVAVAKQTRNILSQHHLLNDDATAETQHLWLANGKVEVLQQFAPKNVKHLKISTF